MNLVKIGTREILPAEDLDTFDSRGPIWIWEEPRSRANYVVSCDPAYGIPQWDRSLRVENDETKDNCAIEVIRCGSPDVQVAEYAAPIDPEEAAYVVNFLGRMYAGANEDGQALAIVEVHPGPGLLTQRDLMNKFAYSNLFIWQHLDSMVPKNTTSYGWYSSRQSRQMLWIRGTKHINQKKIIINSPWLVEEMTDCVQDNFLSFTSRAQWGGHDDRMVGILLAIWAGNQWSFDNAPEEAARPEMSNKPDYQRCDMSLEDTYSDWDARFAAMLGED